MVAESIIRDSGKAIKGGRLFNFYIIWKLHKAADALVYGADHRGGHRLRDLSCFTLTTLSAERGSLETSTCPKGPSLELIAARLGAKRDDFEVWTYDSDLGLLLQCYSRNDPTL